MAGRSEAIGGAFAEAKAARAKSRRPLNLCETAGDNEGSGVQVQPREQLIVVGRLLLDIPIRPHACGTVG